MDDTATAATDSVKLLGWDFENEGRGLLEPIRQVWGFLKAVSTRRGVEPIAFRVKICAAPNTISNLINAQKRLGARKFGGSFHLEGCRMSSDQKKIGVLSVDVIRSPSMLPADLLSANNYGPSSR